MRMDPIPIGKTLEQNGWMDFFLFKNLRILGMVMTFWCQVAKPPVLFEARLTNGVSTSRGDGSLSPSEVHDWSTYPPLLRETNG